MKFAAVAAIMACVLAACSQQGKEPSQAAASPDPSAAQVQNEVEGYATALVATLRRVHVSRVPGPAGTFVSCDSKKQRVAFNQAIMVRPGQPRPVSALGQLVAATLRHAGWSVISVDMTTMHVPLDSAPHPLYRLTMHDVSGAANIVPYSQTGSEALIFLNSACIK